MELRAVKKVLVWGVGLWFFGYGLGMLLFMLVPVVMIGWVILPIGTMVTLWVLYKRFKLDELGGYVKLGIVWMLLAVVLDYIFIVMMLKPEDGYYKLDVYLYYLLTLVLPICVGWSSVGKKAE